MVKETLLYDRLKISPEATDNDIKKAYKKMALKYHPDKNTDNREYAEKEFKLVSEAYNILSDKEKRDKYDNLGMAGVNQEMGNMPAAADDIFNMFFGGGGNRMRRENRKQQVEEISCNIRELYNGVEKNINISTKNKCKNCNGKGGLNLQTCKNCNGKGVVVGMRHIGPGMVQQIQTICTKCSGEGSICKNEDKCTKCNGNGIVNKTFNKKIQIKKGSADGDHFILEDCSYETNNGIKVDIVIVIREKEDKTYKRNGNDLIIEKEVKLGNSLTGVKWILDHISNKKILISETSIIRDNQIKKVNDYGMPIKDTLNHGDLIIIYKIIYPEILFDYDDLKDIMDIDNSTFDEDISGLTKVFTFNNDDNNDENIDDNDNNHPPEGVQCAQQ